MPLQEALEIEAAKCFILRQERSEHPDGKSDGKRWYPSETETQVCCRRVRSPSAHWPWSLMVHCRTLTHICKLYNVEVADVRKILKTVKVIERL